MSETTQRVPGGGIALKLDEQLLEGWAGLRFESDEPRLDGLLEQRFDAVVRAPLSQAEIEDLYTQNMMVHLQIVAIYFSKSDLDFYNAQCSGRERIVLTDEGAVQ